MNKRMNIDEELKLIELCLEIAQDLPMALHCEYGHSMVTQKKRNDYIIGLIEGRKFEVECRKKDSADDRFFDDEYS